MIDLNHSKLDAYDYEVLSWYSRFHPEALSDEKLRLSEVSRREGAKVKDWGLVFCPMPKNRKWGRLRRFKRSSTSAVGKCNRILEVKRGQKVARCKSCSRRVWVDNLKPFYEVDDPDLAQYLISCLRGHLGGGGYGTPRWKLQSWEIRYHLNQVHAQELSSLNRGP